MGAWCVERPAPVIALAVLLAIVGAIGAASLKPNGEAETLVDKGSDTFAATEEFKAEFGDDAVVILVQGDLEQLVLTQDLGKLLLLEGCVSGNAPPDELTRGVPTPAVCNELAESKPARVVYGPATFLNQFAQQAIALLQQQSQQSVAASDAAAIAAYKQSLREGLPESEARAAAEVAKQAVLDEFIANAQRLAARYGLSGVPSLDDPNYVSQVVFDSGLRGRHAEGQVLLSLPVERFGADLDQAAPRPDRVRALRCDRPDPDRDRPGGVPACGEARIWSAASPSWSTGSPRRSRARSSCC